MKESALLVRLMACLLVVRYPQSCRIFVVDVAAVVLHVLSQRKSLLSASDERYQDKTSNSSAARTTDIARAANEFLVACIW